MVALYFFFNDTATTEIYTLSLHDALPISHVVTSDLGARDGAEKLIRSVADLGVEIEVLDLDRKSTRLNSSHQIISYAVFCLKKKKITKTSTLYLHNAVPNTDPRASDIGSH